MPPLGLLPTTLTLLLTFAAAPAPAARPPTAEEQKAFSEGLRLFESGDARGAERAWRAGYAIGHDPAFLVRIGEAQEKAGAPSEAAQTYRQYLADSPTAADRSDIEGRIDRLAPGTVPKRPIDVEPPGEMRGAPGNVPPSASSPPAAGSPAAPTTATGPTGVASPGAGPSSKQAEDDEADPAPLFAIDGRRSKWDVAGWVGVGVTTAALAAAAFFGASASEKAGDANRLLSYRDMKTGLPLEYERWADQYEDDLRVGRRDDKIAKGLLVTAGITAVASTVLFLLDSGAGTADSAAHATAGGRPSPTPERSKGARLRAPTLTATAPTGRPDRGAGLSLGWSF